MIIKLATVETLLLLLVVIVVASLLFCNGEAMEEPELNLALATPSRCCRRQIWHKQQTRLVCVCVCESKSARQRAEISHLLRCQRVSSSSLALTLALSHKPQFALVGKASAATTTLLKIGALQALLPSSRSPAFALASGNITKLFGEILELFLGVKFDYMGVVTITSRPNLVVTRTGAKERQRGKAAICYYYCCCCLLTNSGCRVQQNHVFLCVARSCVRLSICACATSSGFESLFATLKTLQPTQVQTLQGGSIRSFKPNAILDQIRSRQGKSN